MTRRSRRVKILATLGPASQDPEIVEALYRAGADVFRINMSHASHDMMRERVKTLRELEEKVDRPIGILVDLQGPKLRVGVFARAAPRHCATATCSRSTTTPRPAMRRACISPIRRFWLLCAQGTGC